MRGREIVGMDGGITSLVARRPWRLEVLPNISSRADNSFSLGGGV